MGHSGSSGRDIHPIQLHTEVRLQDSVSTRAVLPEIPAADHNQPCRAGSSPVYRRDGLVPGQVIEGPAIVEQIDTTVIVFPGDRMTADAWGNLVITLGGE